MMFQHYPRMSYLFLVQTSQSTSIYIHTTLRYCSSWLVKILFQLAAQVPKDAHIVVEKASGAKHTVEQNKAKSFANVVSNNVSGIPASQFPIPCLKGDRLAIQIPEDEYKLGVEACKHNLHGPVIWSKGTVPLTVSALKSKLLDLWTSIGK